MEVRAVAELPDLSGASLIAGVLEGLVAAPGSESPFAEVDEALLKALGFEGKRGQVTVLPHSEADALILVGLGDEVSFGAVRSGSGEAVRRVKTEKAVSLLADVGVEGAATAAAEGSLLGGYRFGAYKTEDNEDRPQTLDLVGADEAEVAEAVVASEATMLARDWVNTPAKDKSPADLAGLIESVASAPGLEVQIWDEERIRAERLGAILGVAAGSDREPRVVVLEYRPEKPEKHLALVGKGIIFDTGGLSLKTASLMEDMKDDMSGAAAVVAATVGIARLGLPISVSTIAPLTDNAVGGDATRPGDVLRPLDGPTIEVLNTDAEGRLILADGLALAKRYEPDLTIDVATLTGAAVVALGKEVAAVFASDGDVSKLVLEAAARAGEEFWELPLHRGYRKSLDSNIADIKNISGNRYGGAVVAALFLAEYAGEGPWAHLDIAGPARSQETSGEFVKGASGVAVRTLIQIARDLARSG